MTTFTEGQYELDNRDITTTWLQLSNGDIVEVCPQDLLMNAVENMSGGHKFIDVLTALYKMIEEEADDT